MESGHSELLDRKEMLKPSSSASSAHNIMMHASRSSIIGFVISTSYRRRAGPAMFPMLLCIYHLQFIQFLPLINVLLPWIFLQLFEHLRPALSHYTRHPLVQQSSVVSSVMISSSGFEVTSFTNFSLICVL